MAHSSNSRALALAKPRQRTAPAAAVDQPPQPTQTPPRVTAPPDAKVPRNDHPEWSQETITITAPFAPAAEASIDGGAFVRLPIVRLPTTPGAHRVVVKSAGRRAFSGDVVVMEHQPFLLDLEPEEFPPIMGSLSIEVPADGASVRIDGVPLQGPPFRGQVPAGVRNVEVSAPGYQTQRLEVSVPEDGAKRLLVKLAKPGVSTIAISAVAVAAAAIIGVVMAQRGTQPEEAAPSRA